MLRFTPALSLALLTACSPQGDLGAGLAELDLLTSADYDAETVLVGLQPGQASEARFRRDSLIQRRGWDALGVASFEVPPGEDALDVVAELRASGLYAFVEPDLIRTATAVNDPLYPYQWHMDAINVEGAWAETTGAGAVVAVIDTGVSVGGSDPVTLSGTGYDFVSGDSDPDDGNGHGTHVAGTINQGTDNGVGVAGVAWGAEIMGVRVLNNRGSGTTSDIIDGIVHAADNGADVINMSLGSAFGSAAEESAINYAAAAGLVIVAAAGNDGRSTGVSYPARYSEAIAVGATRYDNTRAGYSNYGLGLDVMGPGGDTSVDQNGDGYADGVLQETHNGRRTYGYYYFQGTSMASPHVAGVAALLMSLGADRDEARDAIEATAVDLGAAGFDNVYGYGLVDAGAAVAEYLGGSGAVDADGDGYNDTVDCDDSDASVNPGAAEVCGDGIDNDCDGVDDVCTVDADGDGYDDTVDCDDSDASVNPGAAEVCGDGIDNDCDGVDDVCTVDADGDGYDDTVDCDDSDASVNPGAAEICEDGIDNDCDGVDDTCSVGGPVISGVSSSVTRGTLTVSWTTDVDATGQVCTSNGDCSSIVGPGTSHSVDVKARGSGTFTIFAEDLDGGLGEDGPYSY